MGEKLVLVRCVTRDYDKPNDLFVESLARKESQPHMSQQERAAVLRAASHCAAAAAELLTIPFMAEEPECEAISRLTREATRLCSFAEEMRPQ